jgi:sugar phosphate isomerase/epimerase
LKGFGKVRVGAAMVAAGAILSCAATAQAQRPADLGAGAPSGQMGVQLYDWSQYLQDGRGEITCAAPPAPQAANCVAPPAPTTSADRLVRVFKYLQSRNIQNVELYGYPGNPFPTNINTPLNTTGLTALRTLGDSYGLRFTSRHGNLGEANWDQEIAAAKILGQEMVGAADPPNAGSTSLQQNITNAQLLNRLGKRAVEAGVGPAYFHNHASSFSAKVIDNGVSKPQWQVLIERTDARYVKSQIDIGWAVSGGADVAALLNTYSNRITTFHVKDVVNPQPGSGTSSLRALGDGDINFAPIFVAAKNRVKYYHYEYDPVTPGNNGGFNPFTAADQSFAALKGDAAPVASLNATSFPSVPAGTAAAANVVPITVTNRGDAPLTITAGTLSADANDGGNTTRDDFSIVNSNCYGTGNVGPLAAAKAAVADDPATTEVNEAAPAVPAGTCIVNVGFKPTRTNYLSIANLRVTSNADDATENALLVGKSTGDAIATVGGDVPSTLALSMPTQPGSFGTFQPTVGKNYETAVSASVTSTAGDGVLSVSDPSTTFPGHLVNGTYALPSPLNIRAINSTNPTQAFAPLAEATGTPTTLLTYTGPVNSDVVTIGFRQTIGAGDVLRTGTYNKTLTFTLSTTAP